MDTQRYECLDRSYSIRRAVQDVAALVHDGEPALDKPFFNAPNATVCTGGRPVVTPLGRRRHGAFVQF
ncbi:MAG: hypothetical protein MI923_05470 [Phycisphaerales bacterium]|nr:hypothetical protein [Phycisphaerales bacterium]